MHPPGRIAIQFGACSLAVCFALAPDRCDAANTPAANTPVAHAANAVDTTNAKNGEVERLRGLSRINLLEYRSTSGAGLAEASDTGQWRARRAEALEGFHKVAG
jgi:hypothetical protein